MDASLIPIARLDALPDDAPAHAEADGIDLVLVRRGGDVHVFEGRCPHRGALLADGRVEGDNLICGVHGWDYRLDTGISAYNPAERIYKFSCHVVDGDGPARQGRAASSTGRCARSGASRPPTTGCSTTRTRTPPRSRTSRRSTGWPRTGWPAAHGTVAAMGVPRDRAAAVGRPADPHRAAAPLPAARRRGRRHGGVDRPAAAQPLAPRHPGVRLRHELRRAVAGGEDRARARRASGRAPRSAPARAACCPRSRPSARRYFYELASGRFGWDEMHLDQGAGVPPQARPGRQDRHRRAPARPEGGGPDRRGARAARGHARRSRPRGSPTGRRCRRPRARRPGPRALRRHPDRREDVGPAHRGGPRRRARPRRRLRHPRRPRRRHRRRADDLPRQHQRADDGRAGPRPPPPRPARAPATSRSSPPAACATRPDFVKALALGADAVAVVQRRRSRRSAASGCGPATPTTARSGIATQKPHLRARLPVDEAAEQLDPLPRRDRSS